MTKRDGYQLSERPCPVCSAQLDAVSNANPDSDHHVPEPGDVTCCIRCAAILRFEKDLSLVAMTPDEIINMPAELRAMVFRVQRAILEVAKMEIP